MASFPPIKSGRPSIGPEADGKDHASMNINSVGRRPLTTLAALSTGWLALAAPASVKAGESDLVLPDLTQTRFLGGFLNAFVISRNLGIVTGADGMVRLFPGLVRYPDIAFTSWDRIPGRRVLHG